MDKMNDRCGVFGMYDNNGFQTSHLIYYGLFAMQHRGMEAAGICVNDSQGNFEYIRDSGLVTEVFDDMKLEKLNGHAGIGHVLRYEGRDARENAQPIVIRYTKGHMAVAINGGLTNIDELRHNLEMKGSVFQTLEAAEVISVLISRARNTHSTIEEAIASVMPYLKGGYAMLVMTPRKVIGVRDPYGIRPLVLGREDHSWFLSSETCAFDELNIEYVRDVKPGEIVVLNAQGEHSVTGINPHPQRTCMYEYIYYSHPASVLDGQEVYKARYAMGERLAKEAPASADAVVWVPDSGLAAAAGYADALGIPMLDAFVKNKYYGNNLIKPEGVLYDRTVNMKLAVIKSQVRDKDIVVVDDSMIRGTTAKTLVGLMKKAGAKSVHLRIASSKICYPCYYGAAVPEKRELIFNTETEEDVRMMIGADSLAFLSEDEMKEACADALNGFCTACFDGDYPVSPKEN